MNISSSFNRFFHSAVLTELFKKANSLKFDGWIDAESGEILTFVRGEHYSEMDELKQILKNMNLDYAIDDDKKVSTRDIEAKALMQHIEWIISLAGDNGISFRFIEDEWTRLLISCGIGRCNE